MTIVATVHLADGNRLRISAHAADQYRQRICPGLAGRPALDHLLRLAGEIGELAERPAWCWQHSEDRPMKWATLGPDLVLVVDHEIAITALARGNLSPKQSADRKRRRQDRRARARYKQRQNRAERRWARSVRRGERAPDVDEAA